MEDKNTTANPAPAGLCQRKQEFRHERLPRSQSTGIDEMIKKKKHGTGAGPAGGGALRESLFHGGGGGPSYPSPTAVSSPYRTRPFAVEMRRNNGSTSSPSFDEFDEEHIEEAYAYAAQVEMKRREMGWSTSFPAEYHHAHQSNDYKQTLAFQEQLDLRMRSDQQIADAVLTANPAAGILPKRGPSNAASLSPNKHHLELIKQVNMREGILSKLKTLANTAAASGNGFDADTGSELLQLLLQLRDASVSVVGAMAKWHQTTHQHAGARPQAFVFQNQNYCVKMVSDLNFLAHFSSLSRVLGVDAVRMKQNPFMMPSPIPDRDFHDVQSAAPPRFSFVDPVQRVAEAEKYLVWSLVNLSDPSTVQHNAESGSLPSQPAAPPPPSLQAQPPPGSSQAKRELLTWQQRAETQLRMLSMPLESSSGLAHVMDSSRMMKRKGYLPALPLSPPKTLTQLMDNVHKGGYTSPTKSSGFASFEVLHDGIPYRMTALDIEVLGSNEAPPHAIVTLVSASVLILLSPSDRIPKDLSWTSCQKMLANGLRLVQRIEGVDIDGIPAFKWKALLPFLQNEHFDPMFLMEYSSAAATLCAWVLHVLERAQYNDSATMKNDTDRRELLQELEREDEDERQQHHQQQQQQQQLPACKPPTTPTSALRPPSRASTPHNGKRVTIGNAEVLFINENEPVSPPSTASASRPLSSSSSTSISSSIVAQPRRHVLLRTSPWTHRGVTYFVSFFLEKSDDDEVLSIKMYEPMSSVESQMFVSPDDLALDFGDRAAEYFQRRDFGLLCELILSQLDGMIGGGSAPPSRDERRPPASSSGLQLTGRKGYTQQHDDDDGLDEDVEAAAVRIQCLARQQHAKQRVDALRAQRKDEATTRIQCAVRQRHARNKVQRVRFAKQQHGQSQEQSAVKIQSIARQRQAKQRVANIKLLQRTPTGLPPRSADDEAEGPETNESPDGGEADGNDDGVVLSAETLALLEQQTDDHEDEAQHQAAARHTSQTEVLRPQTSMSYGSEQFEEDFEAEE